MAAASYRQSSPIIGYMGHLPGAKFHVGSRLIRNGTAYPGAVSRRSQRSTSRNRREANEEREMNGEASVAGYRFDNEGNPIPQGTRASFRNNFGASQLANSQNGGLSPVFQIPVQFVHTNEASANSLQIPVHPNMINEGPAPTIGNRTAISGSRSMHDLVNNTDRLSIHNEGEDELVVGSRRSNRSDGTKKRRSKSAATVKSKKTAHTVRTEPNWQGAELNGAGGGYFTEGQALRNLRRHRELNGLPPYTAAEPTSELQLTRPPKTGRQSLGGGEIGEGEETNRMQTSIERVGRTPAPGYTGHLIEMHRLQIGKNFTDAAKESRKLQQSYRDSLNGSFMTTRSHSPRKRTPSVRNATQQSRRSHN